MKKKTIVFIDNTRKIKALSIKLSLLLSTSLHIFPFIEPCKTWIRYTDQETLLPHGNFGKATIQSKHMWNT